MMKENIVQTLKMHYGVSECVIYERVSYLEVMCLGGDSDFVCMALQQICNTDKVKVLRSGGGSYLIGVELI